MKAKKYENVEFVINHSGEDNIKLSLVWKKGGLYLSLSGLFLTDGSTWYELPVKDLENMRIATLAMGTGKLTAYQKMLANYTKVDHFFWDPDDPEAPSISDGGGVDKLNSLIRFIALGINEADVLSKLLDVDLQKIGDLISIAKEKGYIAEDGGITESGKAHINPKEGRE